MRTRTRMFVDVALALSDGVIGDNHRPSLREEHATVKGIPAELVAPVPVHYDDARKFVRTVLRSIDDGRNQHSRRGLIGDAIGHNAGSRRKTRPRVRFKWRKSLRHIQLMANLSPPLLLTRAPLGRHE